MSYTPFPQRVFHLKPGAQVAQLVEHATENRSVTGSIPVLGTIYPLKFGKMLFWACYRLLCVRPFLCIKTGYGSARYITGNALVLK